MKSPLYRFLFAFCGLLTLSLASSCSSVKSYQKAYLNDPEMSLEKRPLERYETFIEVYREGSAGANGGKSGGGCGCY